jgi:hypothetical protein
LERALFSKINELIYEGARRGPAAGCVAFPTTCAAPAGETPM